MDIILKTEKKDLSFQERSHVSENSKMKINSTSLSLGKVN